jgi:hypothetical protein
MKRMKNMTEAQIFQMLKDAALRRYGKEHTRELSAALRETAQAILKTRDCDLALEDEPVFFSR